MALISQSLTFFITIFRTAMLPFGLHKCKGTLIWSKEEQTQIGVSILYNLTPSKHCTPTQCWFNVGPASHWVSVASWLGQILLRYSFYLRIRTQHCINPLTAKLFNLNFHPLEVVSRWRDPQLQVGENYSDLTKMEFNCFQILLIDVTFYF